MGRVKYTITWMPWFSPCSINIGCIVYSSCDIIIYNNICCSTLLSVRTCVFVYEYTLIDGPFNMESFKQTVYTITAVVHILYLAPRLLDRLVNNVIVLKASPCLVPTHNIVKHLINVLVQLCTLCVWLYTRTQPICIHNVYIIYLYTVCGYTLSHIMS